MGTCDFYSKNLQFIGFVIFQLEVKPVDQVEVGKQLSNSNSCLSPGTEG